MALESFNILKEPDGKKTQGALCKFAVRFCLPVRGGKDFGGTLDLIFYFFEEAGLSHLSVQKQNNYIKTAGKDSYRQQEHVCMCAYHTKVRGAGGITGNPSK